MHHDGSLLQRQLRQLGSGIDGSGGAYREQQVALLNLLPGALPGLFRQGLTKPDHTRAGRAIAVLAARRCHALAVTQLLQARQRDLHRSGAIMAARALDAAMQVQYPGAAGALMKVIDVLGNHADLGYMPLQLRYGGMAGVRLYLPYPGPPPLVPAPDQFGVGQEGFGGCQALGIEAGPEAGQVITEGGYAAFGGDAGTGKDDHTLGAAQVVYG